ncbi:MAG: hypothetical protein LQ352_006393 [Teloschistes flavicans]|nr:MAG: hypothetical protein LQ352_006393 [Teloschistes flavicans]
MEADHQPSIDFTPDYSTWDSNHLVERVTQLEKQLREQNEKYELLLRRAESASPIPKPTRTKTTRQFDPSKYSTRFIALKFAYLGQKYNGLEYHANNTTPYPTIEEEMWKALHKAKLIFPTPNSSLTEGEPNWDGCNYSKSGRTDKGVSAFGQVIGIRVRSNRPLAKPKIEVSDEEQNVSFGGQSYKSDDGEQSSADDTAFDTIKDEIPYPQILNRLLPPGIRVLAWCPSPPADFSARFSCGERRYKYFFTQPAFAPTISSKESPDTRKFNGSSKQREGWLDVQAMKQAAAKFEGLHDFRNFCKVDPSKQIDNFQRRINSSDVVEVKPDREGPADYFGFPEFGQSQDPHDESSKFFNDSDESNEDSLPAHATPKIYAFKVQGSAFLWHQVRHMVAILFLVGQGLEKPSLVDDLLDVEKNTQKPTYDMAEAAPLVLEDCKFPGLDLPWVNLGDYTGTESGIAKAGGNNSGGKYGLGGAVDELWKVWHRHKIDETLAGSLLDLTVRGGQSMENKREEKEDRRSPHVSQSQRIYLGGSAPRLMGKYVPVLDRARMDSVAAINEKYRKRKGLQTAESTSDLV